MCASRHSPCSALARKLVVNVRLPLRSSEIEQPSTSPAHDNNEIKTDEASSNTTSVSSDVSTSDKEHNQAAMGNRTPKAKKTKADFTELTDRQIDLLVSTTKFSSQQVREWHQSFIRDHPSGKLDQKQFIQVYQQFYPQGKADAYCALAFKVFDQDKNGVVDFQEFLSMIPLTMSGDLKDRLNLAFSMYDTNEDGLLDKKEITRVIKLIHEINGHKYIKHDSSPQDTARLIIAKLDSDGDGKLSRDEFVTGCLNHSDIRKLLTP